jgi:DNA repair exonuclease SbcCD ATPase subunit
MKDRTQNDYFNTMLNTLRMELMNEIRTSKLEDSVDVKDELNAQDLHIKQISMKLESIQAELRKYDRALKAQNAKPENGENVSDSDALNRIKLLERGLQNFEQQVAEQLEQALNEISIQVANLERETENIRSVTLSTNQMVQKLDQPFQAMREVLIEVTQTLSELDDGLISP